MAYIPPHKRRPKDDGTEGPSSPRPELLSPVATRNPKSRSSSSRNSATQRVREISYSSNCIWRWLAVGLDDRNDLPPSVRLRSVPFGTVQRENRENLFALINTELEGESCSEVRVRVSERPWIYIAENVTRDLISSFEHVRSEMENPGPGVKAMKPTLVARFGKIIFRSFSPESVTEALDSEDSVRQLKRHLNTNIPKSYMEYIVEQGAEKIGLELKEERDIYIVQLSDSSRSNAKISCKCRAVGENGKLEVFKVEFNALRYMVIDISCLEENVDLRILLNTKHESVYDPIDNDMQGIQDIIDSAIIDPEVKGGLRWPIVKESSGDKFTVSQSWHVKTKIYANSSMKLKVRNCDRFDFGKSTWETSWEVFLHLKNVISKLKERDVDENLIKEMIKDDLKCLWGSFFYCESFLKW